MLTLRFYGLLLIIPVLLFLGTWLPIAIPMAIVVALGLGIILWIDRHSAGEADQFRMQRTHDTKLSMGVKNKISIKIVSRAKHPVAMTIRDEPPYLFVGAQDAIMTIQLAPNQTVEAEYFIRPLKRGDYHYGNLTIRWNGPLNFYVRQATIPAEERIKVYPNLHELRKYDLLARRDHLSDMGLMKIRHRGEGSEFESLRDYTPDDPYKRINWKATARRGKPITMDFEPERSQRVMIVVDIGRMMRSAIRVNEPDELPWDMAKVDFVLNSVLLFSYVATLKGDQVGLLVFADSIMKYIPPHAGRHQFQKLLETLYALDSQPVEPNYGKALGYLRGRLRQRSLVVLFTDLSGLRASEALMRYMPSLLPLHLPLLVTIRDPALDKEARQVLDSSNSVYRRAVAEELIQERQVLLENLQRRGVLTLDVHAERVTMEVVNRYLELKAQAYL